jgi:TPR repeat protein
LPQSGNKLTGPAKLPNPELNPLLNPTLGQNLGRWAQVYFTNPPEKRDAAVLELLRELEGNGSAAAQVESSQMRSDQDGFEQMRLAHLKAESAYAPVPAELTEPAVVCTSCRQTNPPLQKFCGFCGVMLPAANTDVRHEVPAAPAAEELPAPPAAAPESDIDWLRNSAIAGFDPDTEKQGGWWKYGVVGVLLLLAGFGYLEYVSRIPPKVVVTNSAGTPQTTTTPAQTEPAPPPVVANQQPPDHVVEQDIPPVAESNSAGAQAAPAAANSAAEPAPVMTATESANAKAGTAAENPETNAAYSEKESVAQNRAAADAPDLGNGAAAPAIDNGAQDLKQAQAFLEGRNVPHDSAAAARLLWRAVGKQNTAASLMLAEMYASGDGVPKNCDQARLLLVAATKKGSAEAAGKLRSLESGGCR